jgi:2-oxoglutarate dehydrogenase E2 component (dihydrolipoamide succinyltransferase)
MGESIVEGTLTKWLKKLGDKVERDEPLFEISTDKVDTEIPAPGAGVLSEILVQEGATVGINTIVGRIGDGAAAPAPAPAPVAAAAPAPPPPAPEPPPPPPPPPAPAPVAAAPAAPPPPPPAPPAPVAAAAPAPAGEDADDDPQGPLSPLVRKMAREFGIDLKSVRGTGAGGRITKQDVENYMAAQGAKTLAQPAPAAPPAAPPPPAPTAAAPAPAIMPRAEAPRTRVEPMTTMRRKIAEHMVISKHTSAHVTTVHKVDMTKVVKMRERNKAIFQERYGFSLTYLSFIIRATTVALRQFPLLNSSIQDTNIVYHNDVNIGVAVALDGGNGLIVPVIKNADEKNVAGLQRAVVDLSTRARSKQLKPDDVNGGTFSITNFGSFGSVFATPVINQPQVAILGVGTVEKQAVVIDDAIAIRSIAYLATTFDHRLIDGAMADQFTGKIKSILENWSEEVL